MDRDETTGRWAADAAEVRARLHPDTGGTPMAANPMAALAPDFAAVVADLAMSRYAGEALELKTRALCTVAALVALGQETYAANWIDNALNAGATRHEVTELLCQLFAYVGTPLTVRGFAAAQAAFTRREGD